jgi:FkbM family methyltransferase
MSIRTKCRDAIRGALGVYLIENRLAEIRNIMAADVSRKNDGGAALQKLEKEVVLLMLAAEKEQEQVAELSKVLTATVEESRRLQANVRHAVNRDVALTEYGGFPLYVFVDDWPYQQMLKNPNHRDTPLEVALAKVEAAHRHRVVAPLKAEEVIANHWQSPDASFYNSIHRALMAVLLKEGRSVDFIDVGACVGDTALYAADVMIRLGMAGHVYLFEPGPVFELARANVYLNELQDKISLYNAAASDRTAYVPMRILTSNSQSGSIAGVEKHYKELPVGETLLVTTVRLDDQFSDHPRDLYLKIDAAGHDFQVARGASGLIDAGRIPVIHLELTPRYLAPGDKDTLGALCKSHELFNLRAFTVEGQFDRLDPADLSGFISRVDNSPHGRADVTLIDKVLARSASFRRLAEGKHLRAA